MKADLHIHSNYSFDAISKPESILEAAAERHIDIIAITDHNAIRAAVRQSRQHRPGSDEWFAAVHEAREQNGKHLDEEEREAMPDFIKSASLELRHELALKWMRFVAERERLKGVDNRDKDADEYIAKHS